MPITTPDYPTKARQSTNFRFHMTRLSKVFGLITSNWHRVLAFEPDLVAGEMQQPIVTRFTLNSAKSGALVSD